MSLQKLFLGLILFFVFSVAATARADNGGKARALEHFNAGLAHIDDPAGAKYEDAYREFKIAYAQYPSYEIAVNIGYCAFFLERDAEAIEMYELYLAKATAKDITKKKRQQMEKDLQSLRAGLVKLAIQVEPREGTLIDERFPAKGSTIVNRYPIDGGTAQLGLHPGSHRITFTAPGHPSQSWELEAEPASTHNHRFQLARPAADDIAGGKTKRPETKAVAGPVSQTQAATPVPRGTNVSPLVYVGAIATGVFATGAIGFGLATNAKKRNFDSSNNGTQIDKAESLRNDVKALALATDLCWGAAIVSAGVTAYFVLTGGQSSSEQRRVAGHGRQLELIPSVGTQHMALALASSF